MNYFYSLRDSRNKLAAAVSENFLLDIYDVRLRPVKEIVLQRQQSLPTDISADRELQRHNDGLYVRPVAVAADGNCFYRLE